MAPVVEHIERNTFRMRLTTPKHISSGSFDWSLGFKWKLHFLNQPWEEENAASPIKSPMMSGGLYAISKNFYEHLGGYDTDMKVW